MLSNLIFIISSVLLNALAQILLKAGMKKLGAIDLKNNIVNTCISIALNPYIKSDIIYGFNYFSPFYESSLIMPWKYMNTEKKY